MSTLGIVVITDVANIGQITDAVFPQAQPAVQAQQQALFGFNLGSLFANVKYWPLLRQAIGLMQSLGSVDMSDADDVEKAIRDIISFGQAVSAVTGTEIDDHLFNFLANQLPEQLIGMLAKLVAELSTSNGNAENLTADFGNVEKAFVTAGIPWSTVAAIIYQLIELFKAFRS